MLLPLILLTAIASPASVPVDGCEASPTARKVLEVLEVPGDERMAVAVRREEQVALVRRALVTSPRDVDLHEAYQRLRLAGSALERPALIGEYESLVQKNPRDAVFLYLAARVQAGVKTKEAIANLERALEMSPSFARSHLLLAEIYSAKAYAQPTEVARHLDAYGTTCPGSVRAVPVLRWSNDRDLIVRVAARLRRNIVARTDVEAVESYPVLWGLQAAQERSDHQEENLTKLKEDVNRLFMPVFTRNKAWLTAVEAAASFDDSLDQTARARHEMAARYPYSWSALSDLLTQSSGPSPGNATREVLDAYRAKRWRAALSLSTKFPENQWLAIEAALSGILDSGTTPKQLAEAVGPFVALLQRQPDMSSSLPPMSIEIAQRLVDRGTGYEEAAALALAGLRAVDLLQSPSLINDLRGQTGERLADTRDAFYLAAYYSLGEAYLRLGRVADAKDVLLKIDELVERRRPPASASSNQKANHASEAARFWQLRGMVAEADGRALDALVAYRNAVTTYPPRRPRGDRRDEAMQAAARLWQRLGGTTQGWSDWSSSSSFANFNAGAGTSNAAWARLGNAFPKLVLTDSLGHQWVPQDLAKKTVFVTVWASWCGPCRAELPYVQRLYERFRGRDDVAVLALNVDDDPKLMDVALGQLQVTLPSIAARDFAYSLLPVMALPSNWLLTPSRTEEVTLSEPTLAAWMESVAKAIETAAAGATK